MDTGLMKKESLNIANCVEIDKDKVKSFLYKKGFYKQSGLSIEKWKQDNTNEYFAGYIEKNKFSYLGILNLKLKRHKYGINIFDNGDKYIGCFSNDKREGNGVYIHPTIDSKETYSTELFMGNWKENMKYSNGIYVWLKESKELVSYETSNLDIYFGEVDQDYMKRGCYLSKVNKKSYAYYGKFDQNGTKNDDKAYFYDYSNGKVFCGKIQDNKFSSGYLLFEDNSGNSQKLIYLEFDDSDNISSHIVHDKIEENIREEFIRKMNIFKETLNKEDYFNIVYNKVSEIRKFSAPKQIDVSILNEENQYKNLVEISSSHAAINLFNILENSEL
jgi:hypothetical protein